MPVPIYPTRGTKPADWWYRILLIVGTGAGYYSRRRIRSVERIAIAGVLAKLTWPGLAIFVRLGSG